MKFAAGWLGLVGVLLWLGGAGCTLSGLGSLGEPTISENPFRVLRELAIGVGLISLLVSVLHLVACRGIAKERGWGRWLGALLALLALGALLPLVVLFLRPDEWTNPAGGMELLTLWLVPVLGYGLTLVGLLTWYPSEPPPS